jgi:uncharacterized protein (DUF58 family)
MKTRGLTKGAYAIVGIGAALYFAARTTGAGWLLVILCGLGGVLVVGAAWPRIGLARVRITASGPHDATVDEPCDVTLHVERGGLGVHIRPVAPSGEPTAAAGDSDTMVEVIPSNRGVVAALDVEIASGAPFGLVWWRRRQSVPLARAIEVAPRKGTQTLMMPPIGARGESTASGISIGGDQVRGVRDYVSGDPLRLVHWPATARRGAVVVKEFEHPEQPRLEVVVDLRGTDVAAERAAEHAMAVLCDAIARGFDVTLSTAEAGGPRRAVVTSSLDAGRRLARATAGPLPGAPVDVPVITIAARSHTS